VLGAPVPQNDNPTHVAAIAKIKSGQRVTIKDCIPHTYVPKKVREWGRVIHYSAQETVKKSNFEIWKETALSIVVTFYLPRAKSLPKRVKYPIKKPDDDNLMRPVQNVLQGVVYDNDSRIVDKHIKKRFHPEGRCGVHLIVEEI